jgi:hypothetical protein
MQTFQENSFIKKIIVRLSVCNYPKFSKDWPHGSLEVIVGRTKLSKKTKIGDGSGMVPGVPNKFQSNPVCSFPEQNFQKFEFFQRLSTSRLFFDKYFAVKSHLRVLKFFVEFINVSKTGFKFKIRTL